jgi:hypothetical protein
MRVPGRRWGGARDPVRHYFVDWGGPFDDLVGDDLIGISSDCFGPADDIPLCGRLFPDIILRGLPQALC